MRGIARPADATLAHALGSALSSIGIDGPIRDIRREENVYESSHRSEVLRCTLADGARLALLCKYGPSDDRDRFGLRRGLAHEAYVYRAVLREGHPVPRFFGSFEDASSGRTWLFFEYVGDGWQLDLGPETAIADAAAAIGQLHRDAAEHAGAGAAAALNRLDEGYFATCLRSARRLAGRWRERVPTFDLLVERFESEAMLLTSAPQTVVHGEFTPHNVVWAHDRPHVVDWEEAAFGAGEIDLASLTDEWDEELVELASAAYVRSRWLQGPPHDFPRTLEAARLYWLLRWLGDPDEIGTEEELDWVAGRVRAVVD